MYISMWKDVHHQLIEGGELQDLCIELAHSCKIRQNNRAICTLLYTWERFWERYALPVNRHFWEMWLEGVRKWEFLLGNFCVKRACFTLRGGKYSAHVVCVWGCAAAHACCGLMPPSDSLSVVLACTGSAPGTFSPSGNSPIVSLHIRFPTPHPQCPWAVHKGGLQPGWLAVAPGDSSSFI